jgi:hypothetical protein
MSFIEALKKKINGRQIRKSDVPPVDDEMQKADDELGGAESDGVVDEVLSMLQSGDLAPDMASVKSHLMSSGMDDAESETTAQVILDTFLSDSEDIEKSDDFDEDDMGGDQDVPPMPDEYAKSIHRQLNKVIQSNQVILKANSFLIDRVEVLENQLKTLKGQNVAIKKTVAKAGMTPVNPKNPVTVANQKLVQKGSYKQIIDTIQKGVFEGELKVEDISLYEQFKQISPASKQYLISKGVHI